MSYFRDDRSKPINHDVYKINTFGNMHNTTSYIGEISKAPSSWTVPHYKVKSGLSDNEALLNTRILDSISGYMHESGVLNIHFKCNESDYYIINEYRFHRFIAFSVVEKSESGVKYTCYCIDKVFGYGTNGEKCPFNIESEKIKSLFVEGARVIKHRIHKGMLDWKLTDDELDMDKFDELFG